MELASQIHLRLLDVGLPVVRVSVGDEGDRTTWEATLEDTATQQQRELATYVVQAFEPDVVDYGGAITKYQFLSVLTPQERIRLRVAAKQDTILEDALDMLTLASEVRPDDPLLGQMFGYCVSRGYVDAERAAEIRSRIEALANGSE